MAAYGDNILPASYTSASWSSSGSISREYSTLTSSSSGAYIYLYYNGVTTIGNTAQITTSGCTGTWYLVLYFYQTGTLEPHSITVHLPTEGSTIIVHLPSVDTGTMYFRIVHRGTSTDTCNSITFRFEKVADVNSSESESSTYVGPRSLRSFSRGGTDLILNTNDLQMREITVATLNVKFDNKLVGEGGPASIAIISSATVAPITTTGASYLLSLYFGDRLLTQKRFVLNTLYTYETVTLTASLQAYLLMQSDLVQNIPLKLTIQSEFGTSSSRTIRLNPNETFVEATGPIVLQEVRGYLLSSSTSGTYVNNLFSFMPRYASSNPKYPTTIYYTSPTLPCTVYSISQADVEAISDQEASLQVSQIIVFENTVKKVRLVSPTEIYRIWDSSAVTVSSPGLNAYYYVVLTTGGQLQVRDMSNTILFTIASGVVDFDTTNCGLYGDSSDHEEPYGTLFMYRIVGFTIFYSTSSALYVAAYPKYNVNVTALDTVPTLADMGIYQITKPTAPYNITALRVSALFQTSVCWWDNGETTTFGSSFQCTSLFFGIALSGTTSSGGSTYRTYLGRVQVDIPVSYTSNNNCIIASRNTPRFTLVIGPTATSGSTHSSSNPTPALWAVPQYINNSNPPLNNIVSTSRGSLAGRNIQRGSYFGLPICGNTYYSGVYNSYMEYATVRLSTYMNTVSSTYIRTYSPTMYTKLEPSKVDGYSETLVDMLPSGDIASLTISLGENLGAYTDVAERVVIYCRNIMPKIHPFATYVDPDMFSWHDNTPSTLTRSGTTVTLVHDEEDTDVNSTLQYRLFMDNWSSSESANNWYSAYSMGNIAESISYYVPTSITSSNWVGLFTYLSPDSVSGYRSHLRNDFIYTGWVPIIAKSFA